MAGVGLPGASSAPTELPLTPAHEPDTLQNGICRGVNTGSLRDLPAFELFESPAIIISSPHTKYPAFPPIDLPDRQWPSRVLKESPTWLSTDLRDGNQALFEPMNGDTKLRLFKELARVGFKEIEVGFPAAS